jgi:cell division protein FtsQ
MLVALPLLGGTWLWLRDSSLVAVRHVHITGVHGTDSIEIRTALADAAKRMTTLDFDAGALRSAVSSFAIVGSVRVVTSFPHTVNISVLERPPVAVLQSAGQRTAVAADATVLGPGWLSSSLPLVSSSVEPPAGGRLHEGFALEAVTVLGAAPASLAQHVARVYSGPEGLTVAMRNGLLVYFGDATRPHAKWLALARVLVSPSAAGALYIDVRLPERPAAGFSSTTATSSPASSTGSSAQAGACPSGCVSDPAAAALATRLSDAAGGESKPSTTPAETETSAGSAGSGGTGETSTTASGSGEVSSGSAPATGQSEASSGAPAPSGSDGSEASTGTPQGSTVSGGQAAPGG